MRVLLLIITLFLSACAHQPRDLGYLDMPEEYLGFWLDGHVANPKYGIMIHDNGKMFGGWTDDNTLQDFYDYKVFHLDKEHIYLLARWQFDQAFWTHVYKFDGKPFHTIRYYKIRYTYKDYRDSGGSEWEKLRFNKMICDDLSLSSFEQPAALHRERILRGYCVQDGDLMLEMAFSINRKIIPADDQSAPAPR